MADTVYKYPNESCSGVDMVAQVYMPSFDGSSKIVHTLGSIQTITYSIHMERRPIRSIGNINAKDYVLGPRTIAGSLIFTVFNKHFAYEIMHTIKDKLKPNYAFMVDELPPFDITISYANEYGIQSRLVIYGVRLVNEGQVMSINDIFTENTYQFVATDIEYLNEENGYASMNKTSAGYAMVEAKISKFEDKIYIGKETIEKIKQDEKAKAINNINLKVNAISPVQKGKKGSASFTLTPEQNSGVITITKTAPNPGLFEPINVYIKKYNSIKSIAVPLEPGSYTAQYYDEKSNILQNEPFYMKTSNIVPFTVADLYDQSIVLSQAPTIEAVTETKIALLSNNPMHSIVKYIPAEDLSSANPIYMTAQMNGKKAVIDNLIAGKDYFIYTADSFDNNRSTVVKATTLPFEYKLYEDLKRFVVCNTNIFNKGTIEEYFEAIEMARTQSFTMSVYHSVNDALAFINSTLTERLKNLKIEQYEDSKDYYEIKNYLEKFIVISNELIYAATQIKNDVMFAINKNHIEVAPPVPEMIDALNNVFLIDSGVDALEFYRLYDKTSQFAAKVSSFNFKNHSSGKKQFTFLGNPGVKHYVYAVSKLGVRSPRYDFYVMTDAERTKKLKEYNVSLDNANKTLTEASKVVANNIDIYSVSDNIKNRMILKEAKKSQINILPAPIIISSSSEGITVDVNNKDILYPGTNMFIAIANSKSAFLNIPFYKLPINSDSDIVSFAANETGIKPETEYLIWIENESGIQISEAAIAYSYLNQDENILEEEAKEYFVTKKIEEIKSKLSEYVALDAQVISAIDSLIGDYSVTLNNIYFKIIESFLEIEPKVNNVFGLIKSVFKLKGNEEFNMFSRIFNTPVKVSKNEITFPVLSNGYMVTLYKIKKDKVSYSTVLSNATDPLNINIDDVDYIIAIATMPNSASKSGMLFIDTFMGEVDKYNIYTEVNV